MANSSFQVPGINLKGIPSSSSIDIGIETDSNGNMVFKDDYVTKVLGKTGLSLKELYLRSKGVFVQDGGLWFNDETLSRPYSLNEIVNSCRKWKESLTTGSLWWLGRTAVDHSACANLPRPFDITGPNKVWSIDRYLSQVQKINKCEDPDPSAIYNNLTDDRGNYRWFDIPSLSIVIPPVEDQYKLAMIMTKIAYSSYNQPEPVVFRLYDYTAQTELTRSCVINETSEKIMNPTCLEYFGTLPDVSADGNCNLTEDCGCTNLECIDGDQTCASSDAGAIISTRYAEGSHLIKVQFQVINYHTNHWERVFGIEIDDVYLSDSSLDVVIFDSNPREKFTKKHGTVIFSNDTTKEVTFENQLESSEYSLALSCNKNINVWYTNKSSNGFTINSELPFSGEVDWSIVNINPILRG